MRPAVASWPQRLSGLWRLCGSSPGLGLIGLGFGSALIWAFWLHSDHRETIKFGILHALTGPMAISEKPMMEAELLAIEEINAEGGILGQQIEAIVADGASDPDTFALKADNLMERDKVAAFIGCWTSACRKTVKPVIERHQGLMLYPMAYEGLEASPNIVYTGAAPNQQILPAVNWSSENLGKRIFLVGSGYVWPHTVNAMIRDQAMALAAEVVGEAYIPYGGLDPSAAIKKISETHPDVIFSTVVGDSNAPFYRGLKQAGINARDIPVISFSISETELQSLPLQDIAGHYSAWGYFQSIDRPENQDFIRRFRERYGSQRLLSDVMQTAYFSVKLWARAVTRAGTTDPDEVGLAILGMSYDAPEGIVTVDPSTRHTWRAFNIGRVNDDGSIKIIWAAQYPLRPVPYPRSRSKKDWEDFLQNIYTGWGRKWADPVPQTTVTGPP